MAILNFIKRQSIYGNGGSGTTYGCSDTATAQTSPYCNYYSPWNDWVRWVVLACIIAVILLLFFACSCLNARRRRRAGQQPHYGTGWTTRYNQDQYPPNQYGHHQNDGGYYAPPNHEFEPAPAYTAKGQEPPKYEGPPATEHGDIELQRPGASYGGSSRFNGEETMHGARK